MSILNARNSIVVLAVIAVAILGGNFLVDRSQPSPAVAGSEPVEAGVVSSESSTLIAFNFAGEVEALRLEVAAAGLRRIAGRQAAARSAASAVKSAASEAKAAASEAKEVEREYEKLPGSVSPDTLASIAECESGGDPEVVSSNGLYHGKYQFSPDTWKSVGGKGLPSEAPEAEQDYRAALLYERSGPGQWPVCGF